MTNRTLASIDLLADSDAVLDDYLEYVSGLGVIPRQVVNGVVSANR